MKFKWFGRLLFAGIVVAGLMAIAAPADAQVGTLAGKVVDGDGKPIEGADVIFDNASMGQHFQTKTNKKGEWVQPGLMLAGADGAANAWKGIVRKDGMEGKITIAQMKMNSVSETPTVVLSAPKQKAAFSLGGAGESDADKAKKAQLEKIAIEFSKAFEASDYDLAIAKMQEANTLVERCALCYVKLGDTYVKKTNNVEAETAYLKAIEFDPKVADPYEALANIYNQQRKFDDAAKMSEKASEIKGAGGAPADPESEYSAAVIAFNQSKIPEARTHLEKVIAAKPEHAEAHYLYGMVLINQGKVPEAKKELQKYLELAPMGPNAEVAKAVIATP